MPPRTSAFCVIHGGLISSSSSPPPCASPSVRAPQQQRHAARTTAASARETAATTWPRLSTSISTICSQPSHCAQFGIAHMFDNDASHLPGCHTPFYTEHSPFKKRTPPACQARPAHFYIGGPACTRRTPFSVQACVESKQRAAHLAEEDERHRAERPPRDDAPSKESGLLSHYKE